MDQRKVRAKIVGALLEIGVEAEGRRSIILSSSSNDEKIKKEFEENNPDLEVV